MLFISQTFESYRITEFTNTFLGHFFHQPKLCTHHVIHSRKKLNESCNCKRRLFSRNTKSHSRSRGDVNFYYVIFHIALLASKTCISLI